MCTFNKKYLFWSYLMMMIMVSTYSHGSKCEMMRFSDKERPPQGALIYSWPVKINYSSSKKKNDNSFFLWKWILIHQTKRLGGRISGWELRDLQLTLQHWGGEEFNRPWAAYRREKTECFINDTSMKTRWRITTCDRATYSKCWSPPHRDRSWKTRQQIRATAFY